jgi:hypothetical protein
VCVKDKIYCQVLKILALIVSATLALLFRAQGYYEKAELLFTDNLDIIQASVGHNHPDTLEYVCQEAGRYDKAELLFIDCWGKIRLLYGDNHPFSLTLMNQLAVLKGKKTLLVDSVTA